MPGPRRRADRTFSSFPPLRQFNRLGRASRRRHRRRGLSALRSVSIRDIHTARPRPLAEAQRFQPRFCAQPRWRQLGRDVGAGRRSGVGRGLGARYAWRDRRAAQSVRQRRRVAMRRFFFFLAMLLACGCASVDVRSQPLPPASTFTPSPTRTPVPADTGWQPAGDGVEIRELDVAHQLRRDRLFIARVPPGRVTFRVRYDPIRPLRVGQWLAGDGARLAVNGGFFDLENRALGLLIADGVPFGQTYVDLGGLFGVREGRVQVRSLIVQPYTPGEAFDQMVQSFPTLLVDGAINAEIRDDGRTAPREIG